ncbi:translation initiation factor IF-2-like [Mustela putorius furo]|uniref:Translation initiation factor IF-2-like n=1 Tax=Mustela putorius furo TaxID=9669 RepID=A0A8U0T3X0_MUSPF|nr:translation initiation factor IF-2-like [Mustela putorius furo]
MRPRASSSGSETVREPRAAVTRSPRSPRGSGSPREPVGKTEVAPQAARETRKEARNWPHRGWKRRRAGSGARNPTDPRRRRSPGRRPSPPGAPVSSEAAPAKACPLAGGDARTARGAKGRGRRHPPSLEAEPETR